MDKPLEDNEGKVIKEQQENEIEVSVQVSNSADTLQNRFSAVVLDIKEEKNGVNNEDERKKGVSHKQEGQQEDTESTLQDETAALREKEERFDEILLDGNTNDKEPSKEEKASTARRRNEERSDLELEVWRKGIRLALLTYIYSIYSVSGCTLLLSVLVFILVGLSRQSETIQPTVLLVTYLILFLVFMTVWALFHLRQTLHRQWFVRSLWISWITSILSILYIVVAIAMTTASASTGFAIFLFCCVIGSACALSITSVIIALHLTAAALIDCPTTKCVSYLPTLDKVKRHDNAWRPKGRTDNAGDTPSWKETFDARSAYRWSIALFVFCCITIPVVGSIAVHPCSIFRFFAFSFVILLLPSILIAVAQHVREKKIKMLWLAFLWVSVMGLVITVVRICVITVEMAKKRSCDGGYPKVWFNILNGCLLLLVLLKVICLAMMIKTAVQPLRKQIRKVDDNETEQAQPMNADTT